MVEGHAKKNTAGHKVEQEILDCPEGYGSARITRRYQPSLGLFLLIGSDCELRNELSDEGRSCTLSCGLKPK
jgi:hypothetical protein